MPPIIISIVGKSNSGKTTLIEGLIKELKSKGYRVSTIKHVSQTLTLDKPGKDSWRHIQAGSDATAISSPNQLVLIKPVPHTPSLDDMAHLFEDAYDVILAEGFKHSNVPKIEVYRKEVGSPLNDIAGLIAIVTNTPIETDIRQFHPDDIKSLVNFLISNFLKVPSNKQKKIGHEAQCSPLTLS